MGIDLVFLLVIRRSEFFFFEVFCTACMAGMFERGGRLRSTAAHAFLSASHPTGLATHAKSDSDREGAQLFKLFRICRLAHVAANSVCIYCRELGLPGISVQERYSATFRKGGQRARLRFATTRA